ncbi:MAG: DUF2806 domain-containing protein [Shewanella sp.]
MIGEKLIGKLWDTVTRDGIGSIASPWHTRRQGRANVEARRDELLMLAQTENDVADIKSGKKKFTDDHKLIPLVHDDTEIPLSNNRIEPYFTIENIDFNSDLRSKAQRMQEQINLTKSVIYAEEELETNFKDGSDEDIDPDWFSRWRDCAEKVSSEELQRLWAKALAGEIVNPGSYSLRTLEFIRNISQKEANEISKLAPYVISGSVYHGPSIEKAGLNFSYLLEMEDLGILSGIKGNGLQLSMSSLIDGSYQNHIVHNNKVLIMKNEIKEKKANFSVYKVTSIGKEVLSLGVFPMTEEYLEEIGTKAKQQGFEVTLADWVQSSKETGRYSNPRIL